ncbi:hypothetical protein Tco_0792895 [Tanacetum coccineum]
MEQFSRPVLLLFINVTLPTSYSSVRKTSDYLEGSPMIVQEENFRVYSNPLFEFDDNFNSSNINPLFNEIVEDVVNENSNILNSDEPVLLNTPLPNKVGLMLRIQDVDIDEIDAFLTMEVSSNFEEGYYDSEGDVIFLESLLSDDTSHNLAPNDPLHHEFAGELITNPLRIVREHEEYLTSPIPIEDSDPIQEDIDIFLVPDDLIPPGV